MSETVTEPGREPAPAPDPTPPPESTPDAPAPEQTPEEQKEAADKEGRRVAQLRARLGAAERERDRLAAEAAFYRQQRPQVPPEQESAEQAAMRQREMMRREVETQVRAERFHAEGAAAYNDWNARCKDVMEMGADAAFASLLVEMPEGVRVTAALAQDPESVQRIANIGSERGRAIALGKYAATLDDRGANGHAARVPPVTRAPAPVRAVTGRAAPQFNEYTASGDELVDRYMRENLDRQRQMRR